MATVALVAGGAVVAAGTLAARERWSVASERSPVSVEGVAGVEGPAWSAGISGLVLVKFVVEDPEYGLPIWDRVRNVLGEYTREWNDAESGLRRGKEGETVVAARATCLRRTKEAVDATVRVLVQGDRDTVVRSVALVRQLPRVSQCSASAAPRLAAVTPPTPEQAPAVTALEPRLARFAALLQAGRYETARTDAPELIAAARATEHEATISRVLLLVADLSSRSGSMEAAEAEYTEAARRAAIAGDQFQVVRAWIGLAQRLNGIASATDRAATAAHAAEVALVSLGGDPLLDARVSLMWGDIERGRNRLDEAERHYAQSVNRFEQTGSDARVEVAVAKVSLAVLRLHRSSSEQTRSALRALLPPAREAFGPAHPFVATILHVLGTSLTGLDDAAASTYLEAALSIRKRTLPADHPEIVHTLHSLGLLAWAMGDATRSRALETRALELSRRIFPKDSPQLTFPMVQLALIEAEEGNTQEAEEMLLHVTLLLKDEPLHPVSLAAHRQLAQIRSAHP